MAVRRSLAVLGVAIGLAMGEFASGPQAAGNIVGSPVMAALADEGRVRVVVLFSGAGLPDDDMTARAAAVAERRASVFHGLGERDFIITDTFERISAVAGLVTYQGLVKLSRDVRVERIDLDTPGEMTLAESSDLIGAREVQSAGLTGQGVTVAVLDTGIDTDHPDLRDDLAGEQCFCVNADGTGCCPGGRTEASGPGSAEDEQGHGTHVSGIITSGGRVAPRGVAPDADVFAIRVLDRVGAAASSVQVMKAFDFILARPTIKVVNASLVFPCDNIGAIQGAFGQAIDALRARGTLTFASTGNQANKAAIGAPACLANAVAVGAVYDGNVGSISFGCTDAATSADQITCFSNSSPAIDLLAPGATIASSGLGGGVAGFAGTSQAAPHAAAAAALLLQAKPTATSDQIEAALKNSARPIKDPKNGITTGRIDVKSAVDAIKK